MAKISEKRRGDNRIPNGKEKNYPFSYLLKISQYLRLATKEETEELFKERY